MKWLEELAEIVIWASATYALCFLLFGCAGHRAMVIERARREPPCGMRVCESRTGRIDYEKDCFCTGKTPSEVFQDLGI